MTSGVVVSRASLARLGRWREGRALVFIFLAFLLAGCSGTANMGSLFSDQQSEQAAPSGGTGGRKVALLLPLSGRGTESVALALRQAAELAVADAGGPAITLIAKDTGGTAGGAKTAADAALAEGAELILGPLLASEVDAVSPVASGRSVSMIAFSSVSTTAGPGTYLMSFLPEEDVSSVIRYAASKGYRNIAALYPKSQYGSAVDEAALKAAAAFGASVSPVGRYNRETPQASPDVARIASSLADGTGQQALFLPEGGEALKTLAGALEQQGVSTASVKVLGTGLWDDSVAPSVALVEGGWYAGVSPDFVGSFERKYQARYGSRPPRIASLAYDAATLAVALARAGDFSSQAITNPAGFQGQNGLFRFRGNGLIERGLAILEMTPGGPRVISPAPTRFSAGS